MYPVIPLQEARISRSISFVKNRLASGSISSMHRGIQILQPGLWTKLLKESFESVDFSATSFLSGSSHFDTATCHGSFG